MVKLKPCCVLLSIDIGIFIYTAWMYLQPNYGDGVPAMFIFQLDNAKR